MDNKLEWQSEENRTLADVLNQNVRENVQLKATVMRLESQLEYAKQQQQWLHQMMNEMATRHDQVTTKLKAQIDANGKNA